MNSPNGLRLKPGTDAWFQAYMNLIKYKPTSLREATRDVSKLFDWFLKETDQYNEFSFPAVDIKEEEKSYVLEADLPGFSDKDIDIKVDGNLLTLSSKKEESKEEKKEGFIRKERSSYSFSRSFVLPNDIASDKIEANLKDGLLIIEIPREANEQPKRIEIKTRY
jgi:HSP20 family protein